MEKSKKIYLDNASATKIDESVLLFMFDFLKDNFANTSSIHTLGVENKKILENSRKNIAKILNAHSDEVIFTSGATESNNFAIFGILEEFYKKFKSISRLPHIVTTNIEHSSIFEVCKFLEKEKIAEVTFVPVSQNGIVDSKKIKKAIKKNTVLVSVIYANNEIGTIQPIREIAKEIRHYKKNIKNTDIVFHTDATQAVNYLDINVEKLGVDLMTINSGKIYGPKGVGALYIKRGVKISKMMHGGGQEFGLRPGTENLASIVGLDKALEIVFKIKQKEFLRLTKLRDYFIGKIVSKYPEIKINGDIVNRLPNNVNITISKIPSDLIVLEFSARGIFVSEKSACKSGEKGDSHVIRAINKDNKICKRDGSIRFSFGRDTKKSDIDMTIKALSEILIKLKKWYN